MSPKSFRFFLPFCSGLIITLGFIVPENALCLSSTAASAETHQKLNPRHINEDIISEEVDALALLGEPSLPDSIAQPDLPMNLRPSGIPVMRPGRIKNSDTVEVDSLISGLLSDQIVHKKQSSLPKLLPKPDPEPKVVYVDPFTGVMVPKECKDRLFDQFVDILNQQAEPLGLQFVILKQGKQDVEKSWLADRKYITGEVFSYVEESGCCSTSLRIKTRVTYYTANKSAPVTNVVFPISTFFDHDQTSVESARMVLADKIALTVSNEILNSLGQLLTRSNYQAVDRHDL